MIRHETTQTPVLPPVNEDNAILEQTRCTLMRLRTQGYSLQQIADQFGGVNKALIHRLLNDPGFWSDTLITAVTGERWITIPARVRVTGRVPDELVFDDLRQCDVTGDWFQPSDPRQRFRPGLSEAVKRAARRDLEAARAKYRMNGDWGI